VVVEGTGQPPSLPAVGPSCLTTIVTFIVIKLPERTTMNVHRTHFVFLDFFVNVLI
jgi:hypothetical protein